MAHRPDQPTTATAERSATPHAPGDGAGRIDRPDDLSFVAPDAPRVVSAAPSDNEGSDQGVGRSRRSSTPEPRHGVPSVAVRPVGVLGQVSGFPIQPSKVQRPPLRDDVLSRPRLNDQLDAKSGHRVVLVVAEAGYG